MIKIKTKKRYLTIGIILFTVITCLFFILNKKKEISLIVPFEKNYSQEKIESAVEIPVKENPVKQNIKSLSDYKSIKISLEVFEKSYKTEVKEGSSVFEAMQKIKEDGDKNNLFDFKYKETSGLGSFVTEINGEKGTPGKYWIYYVNNTKATIGVSKFLLKEGDIIRWNQEGL